jgi:glutamate--cysteine ligase catalytic subunit
MGLLVLGTPLDWPEGKKHADHVRAHGITQFLNIWDRLKGREWDQLLWGDEVWASALPSTWMPLNGPIPKIEYIVISFDDENKNARVSLRQEEILNALSKVVLDLCSNQPAKAFVNLVHTPWWCPFDVMFRGTVPTFHPEYGRYMLESTPGSPYSGSLPDLLSVEGNMRYRYESVFWSIHFF